MAAPKEVSVDAAIASFISEVGSISSLKEEQRSPLMAFLDWKRSLIDSESLIDRWFIPSPADGSV